MARSEKRKAMRGKASSAATSATTPTVMLTPVTLAGNPRSRTKRPKRRWKGAVAPQWMEKTASSASSGQCARSAAISRKRGAWGGAGAAERRRATSA